MTQTLGVVGDSISAPQYIGSDGFAHSSGFYIGMIGSAMRWDLLPNTAIPGLTLHGAVAMLPQLIPLIPNNLIINLGTNDCYNMSNAGHENITSYENDWDSLWRYVGGLMPKPTVTVIGLLPTLYGFGCIWSYKDPWLIDYLNFIASTKCYANGGYWVSLDDMNHHTDYTRSDLHPTPYGHALMTGLILKGWGVV